ncbi:MAG: TetR/AcrR family transcriptional regulator [Deltaproteobacteria bacterium]|nr:MAG: TetR/AcrR family transcriptional regulator [Deltaproteobacteria bacterium]
MGSKLDQEKRAELLDLLRRGETADWSLFWQSVLGDETKEDVVNPDTLASIFEEGISQIANSDMENETVVSKWIKEVVGTAKRRGLNQNDFNERLLTRQLCKQIGPREQGRPQTSSTREKILTAALEVFSYKGFHGATVDEIAERAKLGKGTVYRHFHSKQSLFSELISSKVAELERAVSGAIDAQADVLEIIENYLKVYFAFFDRNRNLYKVLIQEQSDFGAEVKALYIGNILKKVPLLKLKIYKAARDGRLKQLDFHTVFYGVMGFIDGVMQKWLASDGGYSLVDEIPTVLQTIFYGFVNPASPGLSTRKESGDGMFGMNNPAEPVGTLQEGKGGRKEGISSRK